ncbi:MAG: hypothetical protein RLZZ248_303 [Bacteroidota bacterium]
MIKYTVLSLFFFMTLGISNGIGQNKAITLIAQNMKGAPGQLVCMGIGSADFNNMLSMQFTLEWNPQHMVFQEVNNFRLPYFSRDNFGAQFREQGKLTCVWIDNALEGVTVQDGETLFDICFTIIGDIGSESPVIFSQNPTPFEAVNKAEQVLTIEGVSGKIKVVNE